MPEGPPARICFFGASRRGTMYPKERIAIRKRRARAPRAVPADLPSRGPPMDDRHGTPAREPAWAPPGSEPPVGEPAEPAAAEVRPEPPSPAPERAGPAVVLGEA